MRPAIRWRSTRCRAFQSPSGRHWFGTDESGRDLYTRVIHGTGNSLLIGVLATFIGLGLGIVLGTLAGMLGRVVDFTVNRRARGAVRLPRPAAGAAGHPDLRAGAWRRPIIAVGLSTAPGYARIIRAQLVSVRSSAFVEAATVLGLTPWRILTRHILPNTLAPLVVLATLGIGQAIVWATALSYLGLGAQPPSRRMGRDALGRPHLHHLRVVDELLSRAVHRAHGRGGDGPRPRNRATDAARMSAQTGGAAPRPDSPTNPAAPASTPVPTPPASPPAPASTPSPLTPDSAPAPALRVQGLSVGFGRADPVVSGVSFEVRAGECLAIVGESGSGKSVTARSLLGLAGADARVHADELSIAGSSVLDLSEAAWRRRRGRDVGLVLQDALASLDPLRPIGREIGDSLRLHTTLGPAERSAPGARASRLGRPARR